MIDRIANPRICETRNGRNGIPWRLDRFARARRVTGRFQRIIQNSRRDLIAFSASIRDFHRSSAIETLLTASPSIFPDRSARERERKRNKRHFSLNNRSSSISLTICPTNLVYPPIYTRHSNRYIYSKTMKT